MLDKHAIYVFLCFFLPLDLDLESNASQSYAYKSFLETMFSFNKDAKDTYLKNHLWIQDAADESKIFAKKRGFSIQQKTEGYKQRKNLSFRKFYS